MEAPKSTSSGDDANERNRSFLMNVLVGAAVTLVTAPMLAFSPLVGGATAGFLHRGDYVDGTVVGATVGAVAAVPTVVAVSSLGPWFLVGSLEMFHRPPLVSAILLAAVLGYLSVTGAVGGVLGTYVRIER